MAIRPYTRKQDGTYAFHVPVDTDTIVRIAYTIVRERFHRPRSLKSPREAEEYLRLQLAGYENEVFFCIFLDNRHRVIEARCLFEGTINGASVHIREIVKETLKLNAAALIVAHNHPSGVAEPSEADVAITRRIKEALSLIEVRLLDHLVVAGVEVTSLAERGVF